ncbi:unnamed protein product [Pieris macdunnoughi]|uniref:RNA-directed DNA polymerase n=1 Tax=Pieris macdunnoughi TaxID=345717 RepID=A0A821XKP4_9NEOP|nr:unnamed protein product [Pieris macdunnoughi]
MNSENETKSAFKEQYYHQLLDFYEGHKDSSHNVKKPWTSQRILEVIEQIKRSRVTMQRVSSDYYWSAKYDVMETSDKDYLIFKRKTADDPTVRIVAVDEYFDILTEVHKAVGHGGREKMIYSIKNKFHIPKKAIEIYIKLCAVCEMKRSMPKKGIVTKPIISPDFNSRGQDHATKFLHLRPLKSKRAVEVAFELFKIFLEFGAPLILQSDNGKEFTAHVIEELVQLWPECKIVHGGPRRPQTQGSVERSNQDVENMLRCWMKDNDSANWSVGCYFVQYYKNSSFHRIIGRSPYRALFGSDPKTLLKGTNIPDSVISSIQTEKKNTTTTSMEIILPEGTNVDGLSSKALTLDDEMVSAKVNISEALSVQDAPTCINAAPAPANIADSVISSIETEKMNITTTSMEIILPEGTNVDGLSSKALTLDVEMVSAEINVPKALSVQNVLTSVNSATALANQDLKIENIETAEQKLEATNCSPRNDTSCIEDLALQTVNRASTSKDVFVVSIQGVSASSDTSLTTKKADCNTQICLVCTKETTGAHSCRSCFKPVHVICGLTDGEEGYGSQILCFICKREQDIAKERAQTLKGTKRAAEKMIDQTVKKLPLLEVGNSVLINFPKFDRGPLDTKNIAGKIVDIRNGVFKIGTTSGTIKNWFPRQELQISAKDYNGDISESFITLRHAVTCQSMFGGQGFQKCSCRPARNQCHTKRCACYKNNVLCTSKCHQSISCINK